MKIVAIEHNRCSECVRVVADWGHRHGDKLDY